MTPKQRGEIDSAVVIVAEWHRGTISERMAAYRLSAFATQAQIDRLLGEACNPGADRNTLAEVAHALLDPID